MAIKVLTDYELMAEALERRVKEELKRNLVADIMHEYKMQIMPTIEGIVESIALESISNHRDFQQLRERYDVHFEWKNKPDEPIN